MLRSAELKISRLCSAKDGAAGAGGLVLSRAWTSSWTARCFGARQRTTDVSATTKHVRSALRMRDVDRTPRWLATSRPFSAATTGRIEMTNELDRLMTITDLSEMLGVPVDTLYGWRHRGEGPEGYRIGRHVRYRRAAVEAWLDTQADRRTCRRYSRQREATLLCHAHSDTSRTLQRATTRMATKLCRRPRSVICGSPARPRGWAADPATETATSPVGQRAEQ